MNAPDAVDLQVQPHPTLCPAGAQLRLALPLRGTLLDALLAHGIALEHACEKVGACATCHVHLRAGGEHLAPPDDEEEDQLDRAWGLDAQSRLSCRVRLARLAAAAGGAPLVVELPRHTRNHAREAQA
jgi:2Fe-2S ferredoxin